jgi:predicted aminopeptidase
VCFEAVRKRGWLMAGAGTLGAALLAGAALCFTSGCSSLGFYAQALGGHLDMMRRARPVTDVFIASDTPEALRQRLLLSQRMRDFAVKDLKLPDNRSYRRFADLKRDAVVWNVVAAPALSLTLKTWCMPVAGCVGYRGYFAREGAEALAAELRAQGWEVMVYGVPAYSTLGWSNWLGGDPLLNTFIGWPEGQLAGLMFHELAHQIVYVQDDTTFNESFATTVEHIGARRWLGAEGTPAVREAFEAQERRREDFRAFTLRWRGELARLYAGSLVDAAKRERKAELMAAMRAEYESLKTGRWGGWAGYDGWFAQANNASFGVLAAYHELVPGFERLFERSASDFARFYAEVKRLAALPKDERRAALATTP